MSRLGPNQMSARRVETLKDGVYSDGGNLWITVVGRSRSWSFRYKSPVTGKRREMGLGSARDIGLAKARELAAAARAQVRAGTDPIDARKAGEVARKIEQEQTFRAAAEQYIEQRKAGWSDPRSEPIWKSTLEQHVYPLLGDKPVVSISTEHVVAVLQPIWATKTETASRVRSRIHLILDFAKAKGWRTGENPARWAGHLSHMLARPRSVAAVRHHPAVQWRDVAGVMEKLRTAGGVAPMAVRFICLTATRSMETRGASWAEIDLERRLWVIPKERRKDRKELRVPLPDATAEILRTLAPRANGPPSFVFPGGREGRPLSDVAVSQALHAAAGTKKVTVHGLRSTFRDWVAEATDFANELGELALGHAVNSAVEAAYRRGDMFEKRVKLAEAWAEFCGRRAGSGEPATTESGRSADA